MRATLVWAGIVWTFSAASAGAQTYDHVHLAAPEPAKAVEWYRAHLGAQAGDLPDRVQFGKTIFAFIQAANAQPSEGSVIDHLGLSFTNLEAKVKAPFGFGDEVAAMLYNKAGDGVLLAHEGGLEGRSIPDLRAAFNKIEVIPVDADDAEAGACTALCVNGTVILPPGLSTSLRGHLVRRGFILVEQDMPQLWGRGGDRQVKGDPKVKYSDVIYAMDVSRGAGVRVIGMSPKETPEAGL